MLSGTGIVNLHIRSLLSSGVMLAAHPYADTGTGKPPGLFCSNPRGVKEERNLKVNVVWDKKTAKAPRFIYGAGWWGRVLSTGLHAPRRADIFAVFTRFHPGYSYYALLCYCRAAEQVY